MRFLSDSHRPRSGIDTETHREQVAMPCWIFDGRPHYSPERIMHRREPGFRRHAVGR